MLNEKAIKNIERRLNTLAMDADKHTGSIFTNPYKAYAQGIAFTLSEIGYGIRWNDGKATIVKEED